MATLGGNVISAGGGDNHVKYTDAEAVAAVEGEATLNLAGDVDVATGKTLSADGLAFPATQVVSADGNTLDDYEEGSWTPFLQDATQSAAGVEGETYGTNGRVGRYSKVGDRVYVTGYLLMATLGSLTTSDSFKLAGLPFTIASSPTSGEPTFVCGFGNGLAITAGAMVTGLGALNATQMTMRVWDVTTGVTSMLISELTADGQIYFSGSYNI